MATTTRPVILTCGSAAGEFFFQPAGVCGGSSNKDFQRSARFPKKCTMFRLETIICTFSVLSVAARADFKARNCSEVREACTARGFSFTHVPVQEISGKAGLRTLCQSLARLLTCCKAPWAYLQGDTLSAVR